MKRPEFDAGSYAGSAGITNALSYMQSIYRDPMQPTSVRLRAAIEAAGYESPKLTAVAHGHFNEGTFAEMLDRAIERSKLINAGPVPELKQLPVPVPVPDQHAPDELKGTFPKLRKGLRRF